MTRKENNMAQNIHIRQPNRHDSQCNSCYAVTYDSEFNRKVDRLISFQIGHNVTNLCPDCALKLVQLIEPEICEIEI